MYRRSRQSQPLPTASASSVIAPPRLTTLHSQVPRTLGPSALSVTHAADVAELVNPARAAREEDRMSIDNLQDLMVEELRDMYHAENQLMKTLPKLAKAASTPALKEAFQKHLAQTEKQVERIDQIFEQLGGNPKGKRCKGMEGILKEGEDLLDEEGPGAVIDAGLIAAAQRVEHYEIAAYGCIRSYASLLGLSDVAQLVEQSLEEEEAADRLLSELAETEINTLALEGTGGENRGRTA